MKRIEITSEKETFTLEYSRDTVKQIEQKGFNVNEVYDKPVTMLPLLIYGAFLKHHSKLDENKAMEIYDNIPNKEDFIATLVEMYSDTLTALISNSTEGNVMWKKNW